MVASSVLAAENKPPDRLDVRSLAALHGRGQSCRWTLAQRLSNRIPPGGGRVAPVVDLADHRQRECSALAAMLPAPGSQDDGVRVREERLRRGIGRSTAKAGNHGRAHERRERGADASLGITPRYRARGPRNKRVDRLSPGHSKAARTVHLRAIRCSLCGMFLPLAPPKSRLGRVRHMAQAANTPERSSRGHQVYHAAHYYKLRLSRRWREWTSSNRMLPQFIIAGAPKCGTTALYRYLLTHPQVLPPTPPSYEVGYFSEHYNHDLDWYRAWFPLKATASWRSRRVGGKPVVTCEHTPFYIMHPLAAERISAALPDVKIILLLRNPVDRAFSHYQHEFRSGQETLGFREAIAMEKKRTVGELARLRSEPDYRGPAYARHAYLDQSEYRTKVERFFRHLDRNNIMIIQSEKLFSRTQDVFDQVVEFLGLDHFRLAAVKPFNSGSYAPLDEADPELADRLRNHFRPHNESLYSYLGTDFGW